VLSEAEETQLAKLVSKAKQKCKDKYDIEITGKVKIDTKKSLEENKHEIIKSIQLEKEAKLNAKGVKSKKKVGRISESEKQKKEKEEQKRFEQFKKEEKEAQQQFDKSIQQIIQNKNPEADKYFENATHFIGMVAEGDNNSLILKSNGGLGKTYMVLQTLNGLGKEFIYQNSYSTPLSFYEFLYENRDKMIVLDDFEGVLDNKIGISILKSALWSATSERTINYLTTSEKLKAPSRFIFKGRIIFCMNNGLKTDEESRALKSRALFYEINFSYSDIMKILYEIAKQPYKGLVDEERLEVAKYLQENTDETTMDLNFRTLIKAFDIYSYCKKHKLDWKVLVRDLAVRDEQMAIVKELMKGDLSVKQQVEKFCDMTGKHRSTYFNLKKKLESSIVQKSN